MTEEAMQSGDRLLWLAASVIAAMGLGWLVIEAPWSSPDEGLRPAVETTVPLPSDAIQVAAASATIATAAQPKSDPLNLARLALEAGMLTEPADYSAWSLFGAAAAADPGDREAREGLEQVAAALLGRGRAALEQGRYDDADSIAQTIVDRLPQHAGAMALAQETAIARRPPEPVAPPEPRIAVALAREPEPIDPIPELSASFGAAMAANAVLTPPGTSARDIVSEMLATAPDHQLTIAARELLVTEMLDRSVQSIEALDSAAAQTWIDSAAALTDDSRRIARAEERLTRYLIDVESQTLRPASTLTLLQKAAPEYPKIALDRDIEGWVELEFRVATDGSTENVAVIAASHERYFQLEAVAAVEQWRFAPVIFMGQVIPQRAYTRLAFVID